ANNTKTTTGGWANQPSQCVSYVSAHDNYTLYDKLVLSARTDQNFTDRDDELVDMNKLTGAMYITSQGLTFMQAGEEFARTKKGDENSYKSSTSINMLSWSNVEKYRDLVSYYSGLIEIKKAFSPFRDATTGACERMVFAENNSDGLVAYT
ncbi:type I pullulanase, partial [Escherichia coli]